MGIVLLVAAFSDDEEGEGGPAELTGSALKVGPGAVPAKYAGLITTAAASCDEGLSPAVLAAQLQQESGFNPDAESDAQAQGIAQFIPGTWATRGVDGNGDGVKNVWDPEDAIPAQADFMCSLLKKAKQNPTYRGSPTELALAGYNAGWGAVEKYRGIPPYKETEGYVETIMANVAKLTDTGATSGWVLPVDGPPGAPYHQRGPSWSSGYHTGIDFTVPTGTTVKAAGPGTVVTAGTGGAYGNQIIIRHSDGMYSQYAHLSKLTISKDQKIKAGQQIGLSGATGNVTGPHLHLEIRTTPEYGSDISPVPYLRKRGVTI